MNEPIFYKVPALWIATVIFLLILLTNWLGYRYRQIQSRKNAAESADGLGAIESSLLGLMALMLAFTFGLAASKFEARREIIVEEANDIGTAILRCDLYPDSMRKLFHEDFTQYVEARIAYYDAGVDDKKIETALKTGAYYSNRIWKRAADYSHDLEHRVSSQLMIPALNSMIDIVSTRDAQRLAKVPPVILMMLLILTLISSFLVGFGSKGRRNPVMIAGFALMTTIALYLIMELDRPRRGILNLNKAEKQIIGLREQVKNS